MEGKKKNLIEPIGFADSKRYHEKLIVAGKRLPDPYYQITEWKSDLSCLPFVTFPDIFVYCVLRTGLYATQEMKAYRSLEAYNYFESGFVQELLTNEIKEGDKTVVFVKANVLPSQRVGQKAQPYATWVLCEASGTVLTGHCTCMAGLDETCSHIAGILFKIQAAVIMGMNSIAGTSKACTWNQAFRRNVTPAKVQDMDLTLGSKKRKRASLTATAVAPEVKEQLRCELLKFSQEHGCVYQTLVDESGVAMSSNLLPFTLIKVCQLSGGSNDEIASQEFCEQLFERLGSMYGNQAQLACLEERTRAQSDSKLWHDHRHGRVTASIFGEVTAHMASGTASPSLLSKIIDRGTGFGRKKGPKSLLWGKEHERDAVELTLSALNQLHQGLQHEPVGLIVRGDYPHLGASPDGVLKCTCDMCPPKRLLEVKCPFSIRNEAPAEAPFLDGEGHVVSSHKYYAQVQGQLFIADVTECVFVVYTEKGAHVTFVERDDAYIGKMLEVLRAYFIREVLPALLKR